MHAGKIKSDTRSVRKALKEWAKQKRLEEQQEYSKNPLTKEEMEQEVLQMIKTLQVGYVGLGNPLGALHKEILERPFPDSRPKIQDSLRLLPTLVEHFQSLI